MGLKRIRVDSVAEARKQKSLEELQQENESLKEQVGSLSTELTDTQVALAEVYELVVGGES